MFNMTRARIAVAVALPCLAGLAAPPRAFATGGPAFVASSPADVPYIAHGSTMVYNLDPNSEHWVYAALGVAQSASPTINIYGFANGEVRQCNIYATDLTTNVTQTFRFWFGNKTGNYTVAATIDIGETTLSLIGLACNLGKAPSSGFSSLYGAYSTPLVPL